MSFSKAVRGTIRSWKTYTGKSRRPEFWWFQLFAVFSSAAVAVASAIIAAPFGDPGADVGATMLFIYWLCLFAIGLSLTVRRLRDAGFGWGFLFLHLLPLLGATVLYVLALFPSKTAAESIEIGQHSGDRNEEPPSPNDEIESKLSRLEELRNTGKISEAQLNAARKKLMENT